MNIPDELRASAAEPREAAAAATELLTRWWARCLHLSVLASFLAGFFAGPYVWFIAPLVIWQLKKRALPGIVVHGKHAVNWLISAFIYAVVGVILILVISFLTALLVMVLVAVGLVKQENSWIYSLLVFWYGVGIFLIALGVLGIIFPIVAAFKANHGTAWKYPLSIAFLK